LTQVARILTARDRPHEGAQVDLNRKRGASLLTAAILTSVLQLAGGQEALAAPAEGPSAVPGQDAKAAARRTITLITGDVVTVAADGSGEPEVRPGPGREDISFASRTVEGRIEVVPSDAAALLAQGKLDRRLFDVTALLSYGYDNTRGDLPLIVTATDSTNTKAEKAAVKELAGSGRASVTGSLPTVNGLAVAQQRADAGAYWNDLTRSAGAAAAGPRTLSSGIDKIWLDGMSQLTLDVSVPQIGAPTAWKAGYDGTGVPVGVADSGMDLTHPDLAELVVASKNFTAEADGDLVGHGTHVASTIAGSGAASGGKYKGVAPGTKLYNAKVCTVEGCPDSAVVGGITWLAKTEHVKVINMSLGRQDSPGLDLIETTVQSLTKDYNTLFVVAAGNLRRGESPRWSTVASPSTAKDALSVGAVDKSEQIAPFSLRGPALDDSAVKPEITAPGVDIAAARATGSNLGRPTGPDDKYMIISGTSMASPHVAGAAAILAQEHSDWTPAQLKAALIASAEPNPSPTMSVFQQGAGRVDVARAITQAVTASPTGVTFGRQTWPAKKNEPLSRTITYRNAGSTDLSFTLSLSATMVPSELTEPESPGVPAPKGMFSLGAPSVTVPAGGEASVVVTANPKVAVGTGYAGGRLTATAGDVVVQTPFGVELEQESYNVKLPVLDRAGRQTARYQVNLWQWKTGRQFQFGGVPGGLTMRVPKGDYIVDADINDDKTTAMLAVPKLTVDRDRTVDLDARKAKPIKVRLPRSGFTPVLAGVGLAWPNAFPDSPTGEFDYNRWYSGVDPGRIFTAQLGSSPKVAGLSSHVHLQYGRLPKNGSMLNVPETYQLAWYRNGAFSTGVDRTLKKSDLATIRSYFSTQATGGLGTLRMAPNRAGDGPGGLQLPAFRYDLPSSRTSYVNTDGQAQWTTQFREGAPDPDGTDLLASTEHLSAPTGYRGGRSYVERWNQAVFGPALTGHPREQVVRWADTLMLTTGIFADAAGHFSISSGTNISTSAYRDGVKIGEVAGSGARFQVPAAVGKYRITTDFTRPAPFNLSTRNTLSWTFKSGHVEGSAPLPLSVVRFEPAVDNRNRAIPGLSTRLPFHVQRVPGSTAGKVKTLAVTISYDDGKTWRTTKITRKGDSGVAKLTPPRGHGFVSIKTALTDTRGNTYDNTLVRAYRF
jgi:subtilisin family serine protease